MEPTLFADATGDIWLAYNNKDRNKITATIKKITRKNKKQSLFTDTKHHFLSQYHIAHNPDGKIAASLYL